MGAFCAYVRRMSTETTKKNKGGRPTKYKPEYCEKAVEIMSEGYSIAGLAGKLRIDTDTIYEWAKVHPEFSDALKRARRAAACWWEDRARAVAAGEAGSAPMVIFALKNRVSDEWRDKHEVEHSGEMVLIDLGLGDAAKDSP
jgi:hypothetical protein